MSDQIARSAGAIFQSGASAREAGMAERGNPHRPDSQECDVWVEGWRCADDEVAELREIRREVNKPLLVELSDFRCRHVGWRRVVVVFVPAGLRYTYVRQANHQLALADPVMRGDYGRYEPEVIDCLARAVAHRGDSRSTLHRALCWLAARPIVAKQKGHVFQWLQSYCATANRARASE